MPENMDKWASGKRKIAKSGHRVAAEMIPFPRRWHGSMISANLEAIWGMSAYTFFLNPSTVDLTLDKERRQSSGVHEQLFIHVHR